MQPYLPMLLFTSEYPDPLGRGQVHQIMGYFRNDSSSGRKVRVKASSLNCRFLMPAHIMKILKGKSARKVTERVSSR